MSVVWSVYLVAVALLCGSFINLASDRLPLGESLVHPRSHCRSCGRTLNLIDLVPVGGYLLRGGRCATCRVAIGASSPTVELICGLAMAVPVAMLGPVPGAMLGAGAVLAVGIGAVGVAYARRRA